MAVINVQNWSVEQVVDWITGLDPSLSQYSDTFTKHGTTGQKLLNLMPGDLEYILKIGRIGDQLLLHDAIQTLRDELHTPWTTLQTLSLALSVRCKNYRSELTQQKQRYLDLQAKEAELAYSHHHHHHSSTHYNNLTKSNAAKASALLSSDRGSSEKNHSANHSGSGREGTTTRLETIPTTSLASASYLLDAGKVLIRWLTRFPFLGKLNYDEISRKLTKHCFELAVLSQRDTFADNAIEEVQYLCTKIIELCEALIHSNDSLAIQPAGIDIITLRKRNEQDWGLQFESSYWGIHQITGVKLSSPAQQSGHLERGDEILQVNYQTVLAWPQSSVISLLHENENEVILTVKRRPRHASTNLLLLGGHQNNMYLNKVPNRKSFFERKEKERARAVCVRQESSRVLLDEVVIEEDESVKEEKEEEIIPVEPVDDKVAPSDARFWKLYPKPKYLIKRRATVTGASPTDTRPPVTFIDDADSPPTSGSSPNNHKTDASTSDSPSPQKPHQTVHHRRSTPVSMLTSDGPVHTMQLLHPPLVPRPPLDKSRSAPDSTTVESDTPQPGPSSQAGSSTTPLSPPVDQRAEESHTDDDEVFIDKHVVFVKPPPPTPKPRLSRSSTCTSRPSNSHEMVHHYVVESPKRVNNVYREGGASGGVESGTSCKPVTPNKLVSPQPPPPTPNKPVSPQPPVTPSKLVSPQPPPPTPNKPVSPQPPPPTPNKPVSPQPPPTPNKLVSPQPPPPTPNKPLSPQPPPPTPNKPISPQPPQKHHHSPPPPPHKPRQTTPPESPTPLPSQNQKRSPPPPPPETPDLTPPRILHRGILHIRSQLKKQSSSNSASALPVLGPNCSLSSSTSQLLTSSSPRWIRQNAVFYSTRELEIITPVANTTRSVSVSNSSSLSPQNFRVKIAFRDVTNNGVRRDEFTVFAATEVHSRPFAFKITSGDSVTYYLAAESQIELDQWISVMTTGNVINAPDPRLRQRANVVSTTGDSLRKSFARAPYKRSISLGSSQSPPISTPAHPPHSSTPPPNSTTRPTPRFYASSTNLSTCSLPPSCYKTPRPNDSPSRSLLNRSKSSSLKTDWFLRNTQQTSSNISSITITSKKVQKTQAATQFPSMPGTPIKHQTQPMMGVTAIKTKNKSTSSSCSTSPTRKYMCPNCCNIMKVDTGTQTDTDSTPPPRSEVKLVFFNNSGESRV